MSMVNELNSELAMAFLSRAKSDEQFDRQKILTLLNQIRTTLNPLSKADRREKITNVRKIEERAVSGNH